MCAAGDDSIFSAGKSAPVPDADRTKLCRCFSVPSAAHRSVFSAGRKPQCRPSGTGLGGRDGCLFVEHPCRTGTAYLRRNGTLEKLPHGFSAGLQRSPDCRRRSQCGGFGLRAAAFRPVPSGAGHGTLAGAASAKLSCYQHGVLHQLPEGPCRQLQDGRQPAAKRSYLDRKTFCGSARFAASGHISAGQYFSSCESSADRERSGRRRDIEQRFGNHSGWTSFVEKFAGAGLSGRSGGRICAIVLHPDASSAVSAWVRTALRTFRKSLLQCAA